MKSPKTIIRHSLLFSFSEGYPALINDKKLVEQAMTVIPDLVLLEEPQLITEDFFMVSATRAGRLLFSSVQEPAFRCTMIILILTNTSCSAVSKP